VITARHRDIALLVAGCYFMEMLDGDGAPTRAPEARSPAACRPSHAVARLAALEAARGSFEAAHAAVTRRCGPGG
jgi:hypothetical protein